jgi:NAD(P)-dependent dehydrogenase (short-subunit alcohol dehydrogenase family)
VTDSARLDGQVAVVTGAAQGIGRGIALALARGGARIVIGDLQDAGLVVQEIVALGGDAACVQMDVSRPEDAERLMDFAEETYGRLDALVNNAGIDAPPGNAWDLPIAEWQRTIDVNLTGAFHCSQAAVRRMLPRGSGAIVSISSHASWLGSPNISPAYNASKAGIIGLTASFAVQLGKRGIRVNAVAPGAIRAQDFGASAEELSVRESLYTLGVGQPGDIGEVVRFLLSPGARWVTGSVFYVHGGLEEP